MALSPSRSSSLSSSSIFALALLLMMLLIGSSSAQLSENFYSKRCPNVFHAVKSVVQSAVAKEPRMGASLLRLHFHDCFVNVNYSHLNLISFSSSFYLPHNQSTLIGLYFLWLYTHNIIFFSRLACIIGVEKNLQFGFNKTFEDKI